MFKDKTFCVVCSRSFLVIQVSKTHNIKTLLDFVCFVFFLTKIHYVKKHVPLNNIIKIPTLNFHYIISNPHCQNFFLFITHNSTILYGPTH
jgi:hypothetical protein